MPVLAVVLLILLLLLAGLVALMVVGPILGVITLTAIALVAGFATRARFSGHRERAGSGSGPAPTGDPGLDRTPLVVVPEQPWIMRWEALPPPSALPFTRDQLRWVLAQWGLPGDAGEPAMLVVTELLSNAMEHGLPPIQLTVDVVDRAVRVEVQDAAAEPPRQQPVHEAQLRGRGLQLVDGLSAKWGWTNDARGKTVWAEVVTEWP